MRSPCAIPRPQPQPDSSKSTTSSRKPESLPFSAPRALLEERQHTVIEQIGRRDRRLSVVELGKAYLGVGVDEGLLVDASNALQIADIETYPARRNILDARSRTRRAPPSRSWPFPAR